MSRITLLAKRNQDGSYSVSMKARDLVQGAWVDFYEDASGSGYQRRETLRERRASEIRDYFKRCLATGVKPRLFEMTANTRLSSGASLTTKFDPLDDDGVVGFLTIEHDDALPPLSMIDGGTRLLGIEKALGENVIPETQTFDLRLFTGLSVPEEVALFLLINEKQKRVRTDLGVRVVQRYLDSGTLSTNDAATLETVVPDAEQWKYEASRISGAMNADPNSPWLDLIQMPGDTSPKPVKLQAFWTSLKHVLDDKDLGEIVRRLKADGNLPAGNTTDFWVSILRNFWNACAKVNPDARAEPSTNVLWGSIGVNGCHQALAEIIKTILAEPSPDLKQSRFEQMLSQSVVADYDYWFSRKGSLRSDYPDASSKGAATTMTGGSGYNRLAAELEKEWRSALHAAGPRKAVAI